MIDFVTVIYNDQTRQLAADLHTALSLIHPETGPRPWHFIAIDNSIENRGFGKACNLGARILAAEKPGAILDSDIIAFLNPDVILQGPFIEPVMKIFTDNRNVMITGERFNKPDSIVCAWGLRDWVCGAAFFVRRLWFERLGGFDERFEWSFEETDFIRQTEQKGMLCKSINLPIRHQSPDDDTLEVMLYKHYHMAKSYELFYDKWRH